MRERPETLTMFRTEGSELVKGSMLAMTIEAILDFAGQRSGKFRMIECEVISHDAYGTPRELFVVFFGVIVRTLQEVLGADWTAEMDQAPGAARCARSRRWSHETGLERLPLEEVRADIGLPLDRIVVAIDAVGDTACSSR